MPEDSAFKVEQDFDVEQAFDAHSGALFGFAFNALGDRSEAEDCVQEAFIRAWRHRTRYRSDQGSMKTWLFAITRNLILNALRDRSRRPRPAEAEALEDASTPVAPEESQILARLVLLEALSGLTREHREVITAVQLEGLSYHELSRLTGVPTATLRTRMYYGLKSLRTTLAQTTPATGAPPN